jgi:tripartite-type tricarboxylate transporter receptor subunit TctC
MKKLFRAAGMILSVALFGLAGAASAQPYPNKPIRLVIPFPPAGATDVLGRALGQKLSEALGQPVVVENRPGAGSTIGSDLVAKSAPDGYTLLLASGSICIAANVYSKLTFDPVRSFTPISLVGQVPHILVVHPSVQANTVKELVALAKAKPGKLNAASQGNGTLSHMELEMFKSQGGGLDIMHVPYKGSSTVMSDLLSGSVQVFFDSVTSSMPMVKKGSLKVLGVASPKRLPFNPEIPTMAESGMPGFDSSNWFALMAPAGTPKEIVQVLNAQMVKIAAMPDVRDKLAVQGMIPDSSTPEQLATVIKNDLARWSQVAKKANVKLD